MPLVLRWRPRPRIICDDVGKPDLLLLPDRRAAGRLDGFLDESRFSLSVEGMVADEGRGGEGFDLDESLRRLLKRPMLAREGKGGPSQLPGKENRGGPASDHGAAQTKDDSHDDFLMLASDEDLTRSIVTARERGEYEKRKKMRVQYGGEEEGKRARVWLEEQSRARSCLTRKSRSFSPFPQHPCCDFLSHRNQVMQASSDQGCMSRLGRGVCREGRMGVSAGSPQVRLRAADRRNSISPSTGSYTSRS